MIVCTKCGFQNQDGTQFCANPTGCGAFLDYVGKKTEALSGGITITLEPTVLVINPGEAGSAQLRVKNKSNIVDQYEITVSGEPSRWSVVEPNTLSLFPDVEAVAQVRFRVARSSDLLAGRKPFAVSVQSKASAAINAHQEGAVEVTPFQDAVVSVLPRTSRGGISANHRIVIENRGNVPLRAALDAADQDELLGFRFDTPTLLVPPGQSAYSQLTVEPRSTFTQGPAQPRPFKVQLTADGVPQPISADGIMLQEAVAPPPVTQKRRFPVALLLIPLGLLLAGAAIFLGPPFLSGKLLAGTGGNAPAVVATGNPKSPAATPTPTPTPTPSPTPTPTAVVVEVVRCTGPSTLPVLSTVDLESCALARSGDLAWIARSLTVSDLVPQNGALLALIGRVDYANVTLAALKAQPYGSASIESSVFHPFASGTVFAVKTRHGHFAKLRIDKYGSDLEVTSTTYD